MSPSTGPGDGAPPDSAGGGSSGGSTGATVRGSAGANATDLSPGGVAGTAVAHAIGAGHLLAAGVGIATYALLSHALMVNAAQAPWAVAALFGPLVAAVACGAWRQRQWALLAACAGGVGVLAGVVAQGGAGDIERMYVLQHAGIHLAGAWAFGSTLRDGREPLITALARNVHTRFTPAMRDYTRGLTGVWALYFVAMVGISVVVYVLAPWTWWSFFCNVLTPLAAGGLFVIEHGLRYRRHPEFERVTLRTAVAAYRQRAASAQNTR